MTEEDDHWRQLFDTYRLQVIQAGFGAWDEAAWAEGRPDEPQEVGARFERYAWNFVEMLICLEAGTVDGLVRSLGDRVRTRDGSPVTAVDVLADDGTLEPLSSEFEREGLIDAFAALNRMLFSPGEPEPQEAVSI